MREKECKSVEKRIKNAWEREREREREGGGQFRRTDFWHGFKTF